MHYLHQISSQVNWFDHVIKDIDLTISVTIRHFMYWPYLISSHFVSLFYIWSRIYIYTHSLSLSTFINLSLHLPSFSYNFILNIVLHLYNHTWIIIPIFLNHSHPKSLQEQSRIDLCVNKFFFGVLGVILFFFFSFLLGPSSSLVIIHIS